VPLALGVPVARTTPRLGRAKHAAFAAGGATLGLLTAERGSRWRADEVSR